MILYVKSSALCTLPFSTHLYGTEKAAEAGMSMCETLAQPQNHIANQRCHTETGQQHTLHWSTAGNPSFLDEPKLTGKPNPVNSRQHLL